MIERREVAIRRRGRENPGGRVALAARESCCAKSARWEVSHAEGRCRACGALVRPARTRRRSRGFVRAGFPARTLASYQVTNNLLGVGASPTGDLRL